MQCTIRNKSFSVLKATQYRIKVYKYFIVFLGLCQQVIIRLGLTKPEGETYIRRWGHRKGRRLENGASSSEWSVKCWEVRAKEKHFSKETENQKEVKRWRHICMLQLATNKVNLSQSAWEIFTSRPLTFPSLLLALLDPYCKTYAKWNAFLFFLNFHWSIVALQCWVSFYWRAKWISCTYT